MAAAGGAHGVIHCHRGRQCSTAADNDAADDDTANNDADNNGDDNSNDIAC